MKKWNLILNKEYVAPQNSEVKLTFTKLPDPAGNIKIEEITLTEDQIKQTGSLSNKAYDITSDMKDGDFSYNLSLPIPEASKGKSVEVRFAEELSNIGSAEKVDNNLTKTDTSVSVTSLDHFTIFVVAGASPTAATITLVSNLQPDYDAVGAGGVYSAYYGPSTHDPVSPGLTAIFGGREAGIVKAGQGANPGQGTPPFFYDGWDEGLFAFKPTVTINTFATGILTYDVQTQFGVNPVWMTIEIDTGVVTDRNDNTTYQFVPTSNPAGWHTVDAAAGQWQLMDNDGNGTGSLMSLSEVVTAHTGLNVVRTYLRLGMGDSYYNGGTGTTAWVDKTTIGGVTYDFVVGTGSTPTSCTGVSITLPDETTACYSTIQAAIDAADPDETINVAAGTYPERIDITKPLNLIGAGIGNSTIDATSFDTQGDVIKITTLTGNTKIEGFDIKTGDDSNGIYFQGGTDEAGTIEIKNNHIISTNSASAENQFGIIAGYGNVRKLIISGNQISDTYSNSILVERQLGETEITSNTLDGAFPSIFFMTYNGDDVTTLQKVNNNTIDMAAADPTWYGSAITFNSARRNNSSVSLGSGKYTNISIVENIIQNLSTTSENNYKGIHLVNDDPAGTGGETTGAIISGNQISGVSGNNAVGIKLSGKITNTVISANTITGLSVGLLGVSNNNGAGTQYPSTTTFSDKNSLSGNTLGVNWPSSSPSLDAIENWWGNASGPLDNKALPGTPDYNNPSGTGDSVSSYVDYKPWYINEGMTTLSNASTVSGMKWNDVNSDRQTLGESGIAGWTINLFDGATLIDTATTDVDGNYSFINLPPEHYTVCEEVQSGWEQTSPTLLSDGPVLCANGSVGYPIQADLETGDYTLKNFGNHETPPVISGEASNSVTSTTATVTWTTDHLSTSRVIYDTVSHATAVSTGDVPFDKYGYANTTDEFDTSLKVTSHSVGLTGLTAGTTYYYRTVSHGSPEAVSSEKTFATISTTTTGGGTVAGASTSNPSAPVCNDQKPGNAPTLLSAVAGFNSVTLTWSKASDPVSYYLMTFGTSSGSQTYGNPNIGNKDTTSYTVSGLSGGTAYYFKVRAGNGCMPGDFSNELSSTPTGGFIAGVPAGFAAGVLGVATSAAELTVTPELLPQPTPTTSVINAGLVKGIESIAKNKFSKYILPVVLLILLTAVIFYFYKKRNS